MATPRRFPEANKIFTSPHNMEEECGNLPVQVHAQGMLSCWQMSWRERLSALFFGRVWLNTHGSQHPPVWIAVQRDPHENPVEEDMD